MILHEHGQVHSSSNSRGASSPGWIYLPSQKAFTDPQRKYRVTFLAPSAQVLGAVDNTGYPGADCKLLNMSKRTLSVT